MMNEIHNEKIFDVKNIYIFKITEIILLNNVPSLRYLHILLIITISYNIYINIYNV